MNVLACALLLAGAVLSACAEGGASRRFLSIGTAGTGGLYYPIGGALASRLSVRDSTRTFTAEVTGGSVENIQRLMNGEMDIAFAIATTVYEAYNGGQDFATPQQMLRILAPLYANLTHVLVRQRDDIRTIADLRGRRVSVGAAGSGTEQLSRHVLEAYGLGYDQVDEQFLSFTESAAALADGAIDGAIISVGIPASAVLEATTTGRVRLLPIEGDAASTLTSSYPYYSAASIPAGSYPGQDRNLATVSVMNWIIARDDLEDDVVESILEILATERDALQQAIDIAGQIRLTNLYSAPIPLHDAARAWLERRGEPVMRPGSDSGSGSVPR
ncbi:MAG: TAXI family TRAP transporter solute-binding subunit [Gemmatimonadetes bacterium]|nr:TAXI family TRAP transporter solute-binding subunit [Gemmatimonadota bacterium]